MACRRTEESYVVPLRKLPRGRRRLETGALGLELGIDYEYSNLFERSDFGDLHQCEQRFTGNKVLIRCFDDVCEDIVKGKEVLRDLILLKSLQHPCILNVVDVISLPASPLYIVYEYAQADLERVFKSVMYFEMIHVQALMYNMLVAMKYIHSASVIHGKLKPDSILINEDCTLRLRDFGQAKCLKQAKDVHIEEEKSHNEDSGNTPYCTFDAENDPSLSSESNIESGVGTPVTEKSKLIQPLKPKKVMSESRARLAMSYEAPETLFSDLDQTPAVDIWSLGCILAEMLGMIIENAPNSTDRSPLFLNSSPYLLLDRNDKEISCLLHSSRNHLHAIISVIGTPKDDDLDFIQNQHIVDYLRSIPAKEPIDLTEIYPVNTPDLLDLLRRMIQFNPQKRITVDECLNHPFVAPFKDRAEETKHGGPITLDPRSEKTLSPRKLRELLLDTMNEFKVK